MIGVERGLGMTGAYGIDAHSHRLAAWQAATAASASPVCRFTVGVGEQLLRDAGFSPALSKPDQLPRVNDLDEVHAEWRQAIIAGAAQHDLPFTHGIAAKLINCYLKARFVCGGLHEHERVRRLHPPIDALLLQALARQNVGGFNKQWRRFHQQRWSKFDASTYQDVIDHIRLALPANAPLWTIEEHWVGYQ